MSESAAGQKTRLTPLVALGLMLGNAVGVSILALPMRLGLSGFFPSMVFMVVFCSLMFFSAWVIAREAIAESSPSFDLGSFYGKYLGRNWIWMPTAVTFFVYYGLLVAYITGSAKEVCGLLNLSGDSAAVSMAVSLVIVAIGCLGISLLGRLNLFLMLLMAVSFATLIVFAEERASTDRLLHVDWRFAIATAPPVIVGVFQCHGLMPTLSRELGFDRRRVFRVIALGMLTLFVANSVWLQASVCSMPLYEHPDDGVYLYVTKNIPISEVRSFLAANFYNLPANIPLCNVLRSDSIYRIGTMFAMIAIATSFIGIGVCLRGLLNDVFMRIAGRSNRWLAAAMAFIPPVVISVLCPNIFLLAVDAVSGIGCVLLFCIFPCYVVLVSGRRYRPIERGLAVFYIVCALVVLVFSTLETFGIYRIRSAAEDHYRKTYAERPVEPVSDMKVEPARTPEGGNRQGFGVPSDNSR